MELKETYFQYTYLSIEILSIMIDTLGISNQNLELKYQAYHLQDRYTWNNGRYFGRFLIIFLLYF